MTERVNGVRMLDLGCGKSKRSGAIGVDVIWNDQIDVVHDLNIYPYPFEDSQFDDILMDNSLEHLEDIVRTLEEIWRIAKPGARLTVKVPYFRSHYAIDPTHRHYFSSHSFNYFDPQNEFHRRYKYSAVALFRIIEVSFDKGYPYSTLQWPLMNCVRAFANKWPMRYEEYVAPWFPMHSLEFQLSALK